MIGLKRILIYRHRNNDYDTKKRMLSNYMSSKYVNKTALFSPSKNNAILLKIWILIPLTCLLYFNVLVYFVACFTAAAPISVDTLNYFASLDIPIFEVNHRFSAFSQLSMFMHRWGKREGYRWRGCIKVWSWFIIEFGK